MKNVYALVQREEGLRVFLEGDERNYLVSEGDIVLMQFTGLLDKNGKEIYEGDIVVDLHNEKFVVSYSDEWCAFLLEKGSDTMVFYPDLILDKIGNIHQNPELLNQ